MEKWFGRLIGFLLIFSLLFVNPINIYADELELVDGESVEGVGNIEENVDLDYLDDLDNLDYLDDVNNLNTIEEELNPYIDYYTVIEAIVKAVNERDSYFYEIQNPEDFIEYVEKLEIELPDKLEENVTRIELVRLVNQITLAMTNTKHYETELIEMTDIFEDLNELSEEQIKDIETVFVEGLLAGTSVNKFSPNAFVTDYQLEVVTSRIKQGYSRHNLFNVVDSCFTDEERKTTLGELEDKEAVFEDLLPLFHNNFENAKLLGNKGRYKVITIKDFLEMYYFSAGSLILEKNEEGEFYYPAKDTVILSSEEWEYLNTHLDRPILYSEAKILCERAGSALSEIRDANYFDSWEEVDRITKNYLPFVYSVVTEYKTCMEYFMSEGLNYSQTPESMVKMIDRDDYSRAIHEAQHEGSAKLSGKFEGRRKNDDWWQIRWSSEPYNYFYFDFTNDTWVDSKQLALPNTSTIYNNRCSDKVKENDFLREYVTNYDFIANIYGLQGLLQEYASYALESKIEFVCSSLDINNRHIGNTDYDWYILMKYMVMESINYIEEKHPTQYEKFMKDTDMIRFLNNTFKEMDYYEEVYRLYLKSYAFWFDEGVVEWGKELGVPLTFIEETVEIEEVSQVAE